MSLGRKFFAGTQVSSTQMDEKTESLGYLQEKYNAIPVTKKKTKPVEILRLNTQKGTKNAFSILEKYDGYLCPFHMGVPPGQKGDNKNLLWKLYLSGEILSQPCSQERWKRRPHYLEMFAHSS